MEVEPSDNLDGDKPNQNDLSDSSHQNCGMKSAGNGPAGNLYLPNASEGEVPLAESVDPSIERQSLSLGGWLAWACVLASTVFIIGLTIWSQSLEEADTSANKSDLMQIQSQARIIVGQRNMMPKPNSKEETADETVSDDSKANLDDAESVSDEGDENNSVDATNKREAGQGEESEDREPSLVHPALNDGTYEQRICFTILKSEIDGPEAGLESLQSLDEEAEKAGFEMDERQQKLRSTVGTLVEQHAEGNFDSSTLPQEEQDLIVEALDWIGELALYPEGTPAKEKRASLMSDGDSSVWMVFGALAVGFLVLFAGFVSLMVLVGFFATKKFWPNFKLRGSGLNIYIETFAIWSVVFFGAQNLVGFAGLIRTQEQGMIVSPIISFASLLVLIYPVVRGIPFSQVLADIGIRTRTPLREFAAAPIGYLALLPIMLVSLVLVVILTQYQSEKPFGSGTAPGHPIQEFLAEGNAFMIFLVFVSACVAAPIVEEIMFRGVLYRHLRELTGHRSRWLSVAISAVFNGLIFAAIHPQGLVAVPMLTTLAIGFSLAREWRDSLLTSMLMHAINNGIVTCLILMMM